MVPGPRSVPGPRRAVRFALEEPEADVVVAVVLVLIEPEVEDLVPRGRIRV